MKVVSEIINPKVTKVLLLLIIINQFDNKLQLLLEAKTLTQIKFCQCKPGNLCLIQCYNGNLNLKSYVENLKNTLKRCNLEKKHQACILEFHQCSYTNRTRGFWEEINLQSNIKIEELKVINSLIDVGTTGLVNLHNLKRLTIKNTTTTFLHREILHSVPNLRKLQIQKNIYLKSVEDSFLKNTTLKYIQIQNINLSPKETKIFFRNLTGGYDVPGIKTVDFSNNNFGNFTKNIVTNFPNMHNLILTNSNIFNFEIGAFKHRHIKNIYIDKNQIQRLPENIFKPILRNAAGVFLEGNKLNCDCEMEWLQIFVKIFKNSSFGDIQNLTCASPKRLQFLQAEMCPYNDQKKCSIAHLINKNDFLFNCNYVKTLKENTTSKGNCLKSIKNEKNLFKNMTKFTVTSDEPGIIKIQLSNKVNLQVNFLFLVSFTNATSPNYICMKISKINVTVHVTPDTSYIVCLGSLNNLILVDVFDCQPLRTLPVYENQTWLTKKSIFISITSITILVIFAASLGALILFLLVQKNPSLISSSKRVIVVKRQDKAQLLVMPRGYENVGKNENTQLAKRTCQPIQSNRSSVSCDTISTVSYISAIQPTMFEILSHRLNRLQELFQRRNNIPPPVSSLPKQIITTSRQRLPPNVDLLLEYEWYTITTTTTTTQV